MSQENVDVLRAAFSAWNAEDMNSFRAGHASAPLHASPHDLIHRRGVFAFNRRRYRRTARLVRIVLLV
jgi:hypothetical protein